MSKIRLRIDGSREQVRVKLLNWGCGTDERFRRWVWEGGAWRCVETDETGSRVSLLPKLFRAPVARW